MDSDKFEKGCANVLSTISKWTALVFLTLRACDVIDWAWYWILSPIFIVIVLGIAGYAVKGAEAINSEKNKKRL